jgi:hypothetical protein
MRRACLVVPAIVLLACSDLREAYGKETVLYDSRRARPAPGGSEAAADPLSTAELPAEFRRILVLEQVRAELERAIEEGHDDDGALARKRRAVDDELRARLDAAGPDLAQWRAARAHRLREFVTR